MVEDHCLQQLQKGLVENFESSGIGAAICLWEKKEAIPLLLTEEAVEEHQDHNLLLPPTGSVYILPSPAPLSQPKTPTANLGHLQPTASAHTAFPCSTIHTQSTHYKGPPITAYAEKLQEASGHCSNLRHYLKENGSCLHRMVIHATVG